MLIVSFIVLFLGNISFFGYPEVTTHPRGASASADYRLKLVQEYGSYSYPLWSKAFYALTSSAGLAVPWPAAETET